MTTKKAKLQDDIIRYLIKRKADKGVNYPRLSDIEKEFALTRAYANPMCKRIADDGYIKYTIDNDPIVAYKEAGEAFITDGGYAKLAKKSFSVRHPEIWALILIVITTVTTVLIGRAFPEKDTQETHQKLLRLDSTTNRLSDHVDSLERILQGRDTANHQ
jgi:hypothetical protein